MIDRFGLHNLFPILKHRWHDFQFNKHQPIRYYNFWTDQAPHEIWFSQFINHHCSVLSKKTNFYSVLGPLYNLTILHNGTNIFFSGENMHTERFVEYRTICKEKKFDLYIDFDTTFGENAIRFPLWILYLFRPDSEYADIKKRVEELRYPAIDAREKFCSIVASHDWNGIRGKIMDALLEIGSIDSGGRFRNNTDILQTIYHNNKLEFIRQYKFNICPENSNSPDYVTEKLFQSIEAGCIPIYWGSDNNPEPDILNKNAILFWNTESSSDCFTNDIYELIKDKSLFNEFIHQPRLSSDTCDIIWQYFLQLKEKLIFVCK